MLCKGKKKKPRQHKKTEKRLKVNHSPLKRKMIILPFVGKFVPLHLV